MLEIDVNKSYLTIEKTIEKYGRKYYSCRCICGKITEVKSSHFHGKRIKSCGCLATTFVSKKLKGRQSSCLKPDNYAAKRRVFKSYEKHASNRNLCFNISFDEFIQISSKNCRYCTSPPSNLIRARASRSTYTYNGIDRVNNLMGYTLENCVPCCKTCNIAKSCLSMTEFKNWIKKVYETLCS